ncbi:hypothetical protein [Actinoplanes awajinensis]|uniref:hypothetical protein n=1 Tax=Actinoplanes awajinensis TaxID=135946 RepID=UPI000AB48EB8|nr:hypothetical protein [Actinoplanes awajinensis]
MTSPSPLPGAGRGPAGGLYAWLLDGSLDATGARELLPEDYTVLDVATAVIRVTVRTADGSSAGPDGVLTVLRAVRDADRAERAARALANDWHLEDYRFAGWDHLPWSRSRTARYRLTQVRRVVPQQQGRRWALTAGPVVPDLPGASARTRVLRERWAGENEEIQQAGGVFDRLVARFAGRALDPVLDDHRAVVAGARHRAHDLAQLGRDLSLPAVGARQDDLVEIFERLGECRRIVVKAISQVSQLYLQVVGDPGPAALEAAERLHQVGSALAELTVTPPAGT